MKKYWMMLAATPAIAVGVLRSSGRAQDNCPNKRASQVDGEVQWIGEVQRCGMGIRVLGLGIHVFGPKCPDQKHHIPAHQECRGEPNEGTKCVPSGVLEIPVDECSCTEHVFLGTGIIIPSCGCRRSDLDGGTVEDFETIACEPGIEA